MKTRIRRTMSSASRRLSAAGPANRDGSVIVVVLALLLGLLFLGILLYTDSSQEEINAEYYAETGQVTESKLDPDVLFDDILRQIILGANNQERHSPFYGGRNSLLPRMFGADRNPFSGQGVRIIPDGSGGYVVDNDYDGTADGFQSSLGLNQSVAAQSQTDGTTVDRTLLSEPGNLQTYAAPDVPYTYPDHTAPYLFYRGQVPDGAGGLRTVIIPSFERPQLLRDVPFAQWYSANSTRQKVMRPHKEHFCVLSNGQVALDAGGNPIRRFISNVHPDTVAGVAPFPFPDGALRQGVWPDFTNHGNTYILDEDLDGDGTKESVYLDFDLGTFTTPDGTKRFVPIASVKMVPLDSLFNLNAHGRNTRGLQADGNAQPYTNSSNFMHQSNRGVKRSSVNPLWGLLATVPGGGPLPEFEQHRLYYNLAVDPSTRRQLANMEFWWLLTGRPQYQGSRSNILSLIKGRYGEEDQMKTATQTAGAPFPRAGTTNTDDNGNRFIGGAYLGDNQVFPAFITIPRNMHPVDYRGTGRWYNGIAARQLRTVNRHRFPNYTNYIGNQHGWRFSPATPLSFFDEPGEMRLDDAGSAQQTDDAKYGAGQTVSLHMSDADRAVVKRDSDRVLQNAPYNFLNSPIAATIRRLYTTESWDVKSYGKPFYTSSGAIFRKWEFSNAAGGPEFPPRNATWSAGTDPFRSELRELLAFQPNAASKPLMRRLSVNGVLGRWPSPPGTLGRLRFRPLTPHPTSGLSNAVISGPSSVVSNRFSLDRPEQIGIDPSTRIVRQEWLARFDRQRLCRDIYVLLYFFGGGGDIDYRASNAGMPRPVYSDAQMKEMAQFAVNLVDQLDKDDVITQFEYDTDLSDGWNLDDDAFHHDLDSTGLPVTQRGVVQGVEAQQLTFSEAMTVLAKRTKDATTMTPVDHTGTEYDDKEHTFFTFFELQNVRPDPQGTPPALAGVRFNGNWQVAVLPVSASGAPGTPQVSERRLTLFSGAGRVLPPTAGDAASRYVVGTHNNPDYKDPSDPSQIARSRFRVNPQHNEPPPNDGNIITIAPRSGPNLDLMSGPVSNYRINRAPMSATAFGDGPAVTPHTTTNPAGRELLTLVQSDGVTPASDADLDGVNQGDIAVKLQLRRRLHPHRQRPVSVTSSPMSHEAQSRDNPWIVVDEITIPLKVFHLVDQNVEREKVREELVKVFSRERRQPLDGVGVNLVNNSQGVTLNTADPTVDPRLYRLNSLGLANRHNLSRYTLWQPHFDRVFAAASELLGIPLYGPTEVTTRLGTGTASGNKISLARTAAERFLNPNTTVTVPPPPTNNTENRWYRLFNFVEVPNRNVTSAPWYVDTLGRFDAPLDSRTPGRMNLNTMSHPALLAGLLDDPSMLTLNASAMRLTDSTVESRDWWRQFLEARDGIDPFTGLMLPGVPGASKPFRDLNYALDGQDSLDHTVLRSLPADNVATKKRRLFEVGTATQLADWDTSPNIDVTTRYRLLSKVMNNATNRANLFVLIVKIDFFEAVEVPTSNGAPGETVTRIGRKLPGNQNPEYKAYYVIDRSRAFDLVRNTDLPQVANGRFSWSFQQDMDFSPLILHRQRIR